MTVSIIIAVKTWQKNLEECVNRCRELDSSDFEIIILPDNSIDTSLLKTDNPIPIQVIPTGPVSPAYKRDIALEYAKGQILAFLDDDAYPQKNWLKNALANFQDQQVAAVGGPAVTPFTDNLWQKASGLVYSSLVVSGGYAYRYLAKNRREVEDYPSCNFLVRKAIMQELGGFKTAFWPGEDTKLCLDITQKLHKKIIYDPNVLVYHHRRALFKPHLKQIASYALHRGYFVKKYPQTSFKLAYFLPSVFLFFLLVGGVLSFFILPIQAAYLFCLAFYLLLVLIFSLSNELRLTPLVFFGIITTHLYYGFYFLKGLFSRKMKEEK